MTQYLFERTIGNMISIHTEKIIKTIYHKISCFVTSLEFDYSTFLKIKLHFFEGIQLNSLSDNFCIEIKSYHDA